MKWQVWRRLSTTAVASMTAVVVAHVQPAVAYAQLSIRMSDSATVTGQNAPNNAPNNAPKLDSLFRAAREAMNAGNNQVAIRQFGQIVNLYPNSTYAPQALYYRAFLQHRQYNLDLAASAQSASPFSPAPTPAQVQARNLNQLRNALASVRRLEQSYPNAPQISLARSLQDQICGDLVQHGDSTCRRDIVTKAQFQLSGIIKQNAKVQARLQGSEKPPAERSSGNSGSVTISFGPPVNPLCRTDNAIDTYAATLNSLWKVDSTQAMQNTSQVLMMRDPCLNRLREQAIVMIMQRRTPLMAMAPIMFDVARTDPDSTNKRLATAWLLSQEWDPSMASFLHASLGRTFRVKAGVNAGPSKTVESSRE